MSRSLVDEVANAVLYEGYILYPYRPTSVKNRQRWTFGGVMPRAWSEAHRATDPWRVQTECLVENGQNAIVRIRVRFLHLMARQVMEASESSADGTPSFRAVESLAIGGQVHTSWQEAVEREVGELEIHVRALIEHPLSHPFAFPPEQTTELLHDHGVDGQIAGLVERRQAAIEGMVEVSAERLTDGLVKITVSVFNATECVGQGHRTRDEVLLQSFVSTHAILAVEDGAFVSLLDPPAEYGAFASGCTNVGLWPVLVGEPGERGTLLASPIILYDYPEIAPESPGDLFDGTEIDEILSLRILTMTDDEKAEMRQIDERTRALLDRTEALTGEQFMRMHGTMRTPRS